MSGTEPSSLGADGSPPDSPRQPEPDHSTSSPAEEIQDATVITGPNGESAGSNREAFGNAAAVAPSVDGADAAACATTRSISDDDFGGADVRVVQIPCSLGKPTSTAKAEFNRAVQTLIDLAHPGILPILKVSSTSKRIRVVTEVPPGASLESHLTDAMQPWQIVCELVNPMAETLAAVHTAGVAHGGLQPARIFPTASGGPILADASVSAVESASFSGIPDAADACRSPEQWGSNRSSLTPAMDVYSLGVILYRLLCGRYPFRAKSRIELMGQVVDDPPQPPRQLTSKIPRRLEELCLQCLAKQPADRPRDCAQVASELRDLLMVDDEGDSIESLSGSISSSFRRQAPSEPTGPERFMLIEITDSNGEVAGSILQTAVSATLEARAARPMDGWMFRLPDLMHADDWLIWFANSALNVLRLIGAAPERSEDADNSGWNVRLSSLSREVPDAEVESAEYREHVCRIDAAFDHDDVTITPENLRFLQRGLTRQCLQVQPAEYILHADDGAELSVHVAAAAQVPPLAGRQAQSAMLQSRWEQACAGMGQIVLVIGDEGTGKSRLVSNLSDSLSESSTDILVLQAYCRPSQRGRALHPILEWLTRMLGEQGQQTDEERRQALGRLINTQALNDASAGQLLEVELGLAESGSEWQSLSETQRMSRLKQLLLDWLQAVALQTPVLLVIEDLQWVDAATLWFLEQLVELGFNNRILTLLSCRSEFETPWGSRAHQTQVALNRLTKKHVATLVESITGVEPDSTTLSEIRSLTGSIPLFIEHHAKYTLTR